jgi:hypothetical protein
MKDIVLYEGGQVYFLTWFFESLVWLMLPNYQENSLLKLTPFYNRFLPITYYKCYKQALNG